MTLQGLSFGTPGTQPVGRSTNLVMVPDVEGFDQADARKELEDRGFRVALQYVEESGTTEGKVTFQRPEGDEPRPRASAVTVFVVRNPPQSADWTARFDHLSDAVALLETDAKAESRKTEILDALNSMTGAASKASGSASKSAG